MDTSSSLPRAGLTLGELLAVPYVFSQTGLLEPHQFVRAARERGVRLTVGQLQLLHRRRVLTPLIQIHTRRIGKAVQGGALSGATSSASYEVDRALKEGRVSDPGARRFASWPSRERGTQPVILYSRFQLLALKLIEGQLRSARRLPLGPDKWDMPRADEVARARFVRERQLALSLEVLAPRYRPRVVGQVRLLRPDDNPEFLVGRPTVETNALHGEPASLTSAAENLLHQARAIDPLGPWSEVVRAGNPRQWPKLRFDALLAHEMREAAELLLLYYEDLAADDEVRTLGAPDEQWHQPRHDRLQISSQQRRETIMSFRLHTRPNVFLALEGETEISIVERILDNFGVDADAAGLAIFNLRSVDGDVRLLARAVAAPYFVQDGRFAGRLLEPLTGVLVAVDPEKKYRSAELRLKQRDGMVQSVLESLPKSLRTKGLQSDLEHILRVRTWGDKHSFELAHFNDREIAHALVRCPSAVAPSLKQVERAVERVRHQGEDVGRVWKDWLRGASKIELADALWPVLDARLTGELAPGELPIVDAVDEALALAMELRRITWVTTEEDD